MHGPSVSAARIGRTTHKVPIFSGSHGQVTACATQTQLEFLLAGITDSTSIDDFDYSIPTVQTTIGGVSAARIIRTANKVSVLAVAQRQNTCLAGWAVRTRSGLYSKAFYRVAGALYTFSESPKHGL